MSDTKREGETPLPKLSFGNKQRIRVQEYYPHWCPRCHIRFYDTVRLSDPWKYCSECALKGAVIAREATKENKQRDWINDPKIPIEEYDGNV